MPWDIDVELIQEWLLGLDDATYDQVIAALRILRQDGPGLGRPLVDSVKGSRHHRMKELRPGSVGRSEIRILFAFDPERRAIMLLAGDKRGNWQGWYRTHIPLADDRFDIHLRDLKAGET